VNEKVLVYRYMYWDESKRVRKTSLMYATSDVIRDGLGTAIHSSAQDYWTIRLRAL